MINNKYSILWVDDELDLLRPHFIFLEKKGYFVEGVPGGADALDLIKSKDFDVILLDENMPGLSGLDTLNAILSFNSSLPVVMVTKSEEEELMDKAIANKIADFLIKPINPHQLLLSLKKILEKKSIISRATLSGYREAFYSLSEKISRACDINDWYGIYSELTRWSVDIDKYSPDLKEMFEMQYREARQLFSRFVIRHYKDWILTPDKAPVMSPNLFPQKVFPLLENGEKVFFVLIDNFRFDQWLSVKNELAEFFSVRREELYTAILPTATQYARNAVFSGLMPIDIERLFPELWVDEESEE